jgi:hypothetical protein
MMHIPQVVLFGSIAGGWREQHIIPVLEELGVTYYNPVQPMGWTHQSGDIEAELMAKCETIVMPFNTTTPAFTALAEAGWAALGVALRNQHLILQIDLDYPVALDETITSSEAGQQLQRALQHYATSSRYLVYKHAMEFQHPRLHIVKDIAAIADKLREIYGGSTRPA